jgi:hypothetical protein
MPPTPSILAKPPYPAFSTTTMGQYWRVVNLDKHQTPSKGHWGELGECLFDSSPDMLVPLLKQPFDTDPHATNSDSALPPEHS